MMGPEGPVHLLRVRFPELAFLFSGPGKLDPEVPEPYSSMGRFAEEVLQEALGDLLEGLVHDAAFVAALYPNLNAVAKERLQAAAQ